VVSLSDEPQILLALPWLYNLASSKAFKLVWSNPDALRIDPFASTADSAAASTVGVESVEPAAPESNEATSAESSSVVESGAGAAEEAMAAAIAAVGKDTLQFRLHRAVAYWHAVWRGLSAKSLPFPALSLVASPLASSSAENGLEALSSTAFSAFRHITEHWKAKQALPR
jgi:hypothetical protein